jgi:hypothetical protein
LRSRFRVNQSWKNVKLRANKSASIQWRLWRSEHKWGDGENPVFGVGYNRNISCRGGGSTPATPPMSAQPRVGIRRDIYRVVTIMMMRRLYKSTPISYPSELLEILRQLICNDYTETKCATLRYRVASMTDVAYVGSSEMLQHLDPEQLRQWL